VLTVPTAYLGVLDSAVHGLCVTDEEKAEPSKYTIKFGANNYVILKYGCVKGECSEEEDLGRISTSIGKATALQSLA